MATQIACAEDVAPGNRLDYWRHITHEAFVPFDLRVVGAAERYRGTVLTRSLMGAWMSLLDSSPVEAHRTPSLIRHDAAEVYKLEVELGGRVVSTADDREAVLHAGDFAIYDMTRPYASGPYPSTESSAEPFRLLGVMIPKPLLPLSPDLIGQLTATRFSGQTGIGKLISTILAHLATDLDSYEQVEADAAITAALDLLTAGLAGRLELGSAVPERTRRSALLARIHAFIERYLGEPTLCPSMVAAANHVSLRQLHKLFEAEGVTVAGWIRARRLECCRRDLVDPRNRSSSVHAIGARWGLTDPAHFSRIFRTAYGAPPGEYRWAHLGQAAPPYRPLPFPETGR